MSFLGQFSDINYIYHYLFSKHFYAPSPPTETLYPLSNSSPIPLLTPNPGHL